MWDVKDHVFYMFWTYRVYLDWSGDEKGKKLGERE